MSKMIAFVSLKRSNMLSTIVRWQPVQIGVADVPREELQDVSLSLRPQRVSIRQSILCSASCRVRPSRPRTSTWAVVLSAPLRSCRAMFTSCDWGVELALAAASWAKRFVAWMPSTVRTMSPIRHRRLGRRCRSGSRRSPAGARCSRPDRGRRPAAPGAEHRAGDESVGVMDVVDDAGDSEGIPRRIARRLETGEWRS